MMNGAGSASDWTEHTHSDGRRYYYNNKTKASSWDKPDALKSSEELKNTTSWKEYKTADGRDYFFNPTTKQSVWEMPQELRRLRGLPTESDEERERDKDEKDSDKEDDDAPKYDSPEARKEAFFLLLEEKGVKEKSKWDEAMKLIQDDKRFNAFPTGGERKQAFAEWLTKAKKRAVEQARQKKLKAKDDWATMIKEWDGLKPSTRYRDVAYEFFQSETFKLIDEDDRDEIFQDVMDDLDKQRKDERRKNKKGLLDKAKKLFIEDENITPLSRWRDVQDAFRDNDIYKVLSKVDVLTAWEEWSEEAEKKELEQKRKEKFRAERLFRDEFRKILDVYYKQGKITTETFWGSFVQEINEEEAYVKLIGQPGSKPHDLFDDYIESLHEKMKQEMKRIAKLAKARDVVVTPGSTYEWFAGQLVSEDTWQKAREQVRLQAFEMLVQRAKDQETAAVADAEKAAKKNRKNFVELLQKTREVTAATTYDMAEILLCSNSAWNAVDDRTRRQCFDIFVDQLKIQHEARGGAAPEDEESDEDRGAKKDKKKAKRRKQEEEPEDSPPPRKSKKDDEPEKKRKKRDRDEEDEPEPEKKKSRKHRRDD